jgi:hypothetical protein
MRDLQSERLVELDNKKCRAELLTPLFRRTPPPYRKKIVGKRKWLWFTLDDVEDGWFCPECMEPINRFFHSTKLAPGNRSIWDGYDWILYTCPSPICNYEAGIKVEWWQHVESLG